MLNFAFFNRFVVALENLAGSSAAAVPVPASPFFQMRGSIERGGEGWVAWVGPDQKNGVAGAGKTPRQAVEAFDSAWENG
jgi:hypothetical protein